MFSRFFICLSLAAVFAFLPFLMSETQAQDGIYDAKGISKSPYQYGEPVSEGYAQARFHDVAVDRVGRTYDYAEDITYILAGCGILGLALMATIGKWQWKWFFMLIGGLFILAGFRALINFLN
ncbi:MAG: hypothetical protein ACTSXQ_07080 [Alphaproteobacteria bacterium]